MKIRQAVEEFAGSGRTSMSCQEIVDHATDRCGFDVAATAVSRIMGSLGWEKFRLEDKVHFRQPTKEEASFREGFACGLSCKSGETADDYWPASKSAQQD